MIVVRRFARGVFFFSSFAESPGGLEKPRQPGCGVGRVCLLRLAGKKKMSFTAEAVCVC